jgi:hypothetical protein
MVWSSANKTRILVFGISFHLLERNFNVNAESALVSILDNQLAPKLSCSRTHAYHTEARSFFARREPQAMPVVFDIDPDSAIGNVKSHNGLGRFRMAGDIGQCLLRDPEQVSFQTFGHTPGEVRRVLDSDLRPLRKSLAKPAQPGVKTEIVENYRPQNL